MQGCSFIATSHQLSTRPAPSVCRTPDCTEIQYLVYLTQMQMFVLSHLQHHREIICPLLFPKPEQGYNRVLPLWPPRKLGALFTQNQGKNAADICTTHGHKNNCDRLPRQPGYFQEPFLQRPCKFTI